MLQTANRITLQGRVAVPRTRVARNGLLFGKVELALDDRASIAVSNFGTQPDDLTSLRPGDELYVEGELAIDHLSEEVYVRAAAIWRMVPPWLAGRKRRQVPYGDSRAARGSPEKS